MGADQHIGFAPMPAVARILAGFERDQLANFVEVAIGLLDVMEGDPDSDEGDTEDAFAFSKQATGYYTGPGCPVSDNGEQAYVEWTTMRGSQKGGANVTLGDEDDEEDDPSGQCDEDGINTRADLALSAAPGCPIGDPDYGIDDQRCDEPHQDLEREQMPHDVPMLPVVTLEHNIFSDARVSLGFSNLQSSFISGAPVRSADSGAMFAPQRCELGARPGVPV